MMKIDVEKKLAKVNDILEQISELNKLLAFLDENKADPSSVRQYEFMRQEFIKELNGIMKEFQLSVHRLEMAA